MATIEISQLSEHLDQVQIEAMLSAISDETTDTLELGDGEDSIVIDSNIDDDLFVDFLGRLDANDLDADIYIPLDFEEVVKVGEFRIGSTHALQLVLDNLREDFFVEAESEEEDHDLVGDEFDIDSESGEDEGEHPDEMGDELGGEPSYSNEDHGDIDAKDEQLRYIWRILHRAAKDSLQSNLALILHQ